MKHERSAGGVVFRMQDGVPLFLLIRDSYGNWGFPKGHLERGERPDTAALREVMEETGIRSLSLVAEIDEIEWFFRFGGKLIHKRCHYYLMHTDLAETRPQQAEGISACRWVGVEEARELISYENARGVLRRAYEMVAPQLPAAPVPRPAGI